MLPSVSRTGVNKSAKCTVKPLKRQPEKTREARPDAPPTPNAWERPASASGLPAGTPSWITPELVALTLKVWQKHYREPLSVQDAVTIVQNAGQLFGILPRE